MFILIALSVPCGGRSNKTKGCRGTRIGAAADLTLAVGRRMTALLEAVKESHEIRNLLSLLSQPQADRREDRTHRPMNILLRKWKIG